MGAPTAWPLSTAENKRRPSLESCKPCEQWHYWDCDSKNKMNLTHGFRVRGLMNHADQPAEDLSADPEEGISHAWRHPKHADKLVNNHVALLQEEAGNMLFKKKKKEKKTCTETNMLQHGTSTDMKYHTEPEILWLNNNLWSQLRFHFKTGFRKKTASEIISRLFHSIFRNMFRIYFSIRLVVNQTLIKA